MASDRRREMVKDDTTRPLERRRKSAHPPRRKDKKDSRTSTRLKVVDLAPEDKPSDLEALRKARLDHINTPADEQKKMKYIGETITREPANKADLHHVRKVSATKRRRKGIESERKHRQRKVRATEAESGEYQPVYETRHRERDVEPISVEAEEKETDDIGHGSDVQPTTPPEPSQRPVERRSKTGDAQRPGGRDGIVKKQRQTSRRRQSEPIERIHHIHRNSPGIDDCQPALIQRSTMPEHGSRASPLSLQRSATTMRSKSDATLTTKPNSIRSKTAPSIAESHAKKGSSLFSTLLRGSPTTQMSLKKVTCLTCGSDDVPFIKTAKLACTHRMCHDCLRRIFTMSVTDPAHMPPKCCTAEHIPLKHVDKLFDQKFKKTWNRKFQEYTTRNRIYCPTRHCGEWIKPNHIHLENGRKVGKCKRCGTRVCCICNNKMHTSRECPKDPATKIFVEVAKKEGWQRCFNCSAMVELKEGCNHMTCRCTAEFCMICGNKWKTCDCPWFNYEAVEADRLEHMNMAQGQRVHNDEDRRAPIRYQEEMDRRRHQERRDEALARRMQVLGVEDDPSDDIQGDPIGQLFGIGNAAEHFLNHDFRQQARNLLTGNFGHAAQAAERLLNGAVTGRENPLPPAPFELDAPARNAANQTAQLLRHGASNTALDTAGAGRRSNDQANPRRRAGNEALSHATNELLESTVPLPATLLNVARRPTLRNANQPRRASGLVSLLAGGRSQTANERVTEQRIEDWRSDVPIGEPAEGGTLV